MFYHRLRSYVVMLNPSATEPMEELEFVREGFSFFAFLFTIFWALYHRCWHFAGVILLLNLLLVLLLQYSGFLTDDAVGVIQFGIQLWVGFEANNYLQNALRRRGYITYGVVSGENQTRAYQRFLDRHCRQFSPA